MCLDEFLWFLLVFPKPPPACGVVFALRECERGNFCVFGVALGPAGPGLGWGRFGLGLGLGKILGHWELPEATRGFQEPSGAASCRQVPKGTIKSLPEPPRASQSLPGAIRNHQKPPGTNRRRQKPPAQ